MTQAYEFFIDADAPDPIIHRGLPPVDQSALVATLQGKVGALTSVLQATLARAEARKAADAAKVDGQDDIDAITAVLAP